MTSQGELEGLCVLVTGGSMGIGLASAEAALRAGARVGICARTLQAVNSAVDHLSSLGLDECVGFRCDVTQVEDLERTFDGLERRFGPMGAIIHAAGILGPIGMVSEVDESAWLDALTVNLFGSFLVVGKGAKRLACNGGGRIALFAGGGAASPFPNYSAYACGKAGLVRLTETAAIELAGNGVEVNCIAPGFVITRLHQQTLAAGERAGEEYLNRTRLEIAAGGVPASVGADAAVFLISEASRGITGRFVAAQYDAYRDWPSHLSELQGTDAFTLRRIVPSDCGTN